MLRLWCPFLVMLRLRLRPPAQALVISRTLYRCQHIGPSTSSAPVAPVTLPSEPAASADVPASKNAPARWQDSDWVWISGLILGVCAISSPFVLISMVQDDAEVRAAVRAAAPAAMEALGTVLEIPPDAGYDAVPDTSPVIVLRADGSPAFSEALPADSLLPGGVSSGDALDGVLRFAAAGLRTTPPVQRHGVGAVALVAADPAHVALRTAALGAPTRLADLRLESTAASAAAASAALARRQLRASAPEFAAADVALLAALSRAEEAQRAVDTASLFDHTFSVANDDENDDLELQNFDKKRRQRSWLQLPWGATAIATSEAPPRLRQTTYSERLSRLYCRRAAALARAREAEARVAEANERRRAAADIAPPLVPRDSVGNRVRLAPSTAAVIAAGAALGSS